MYKKPSGFNSDQFKYMIEFARGEIGKEEFLKLSDKGNKKWVEMAELVKNPYLCKLFINKLPFTLRPRALKEIHNLTNKEIRDMRKDKGFSGQVDQYIAGNFTNNSVSNYLNELAVIFDIPVEYFIVDDPYVERNSFTEYFKLNNRSTLKEVIADLKIRPTGRFIKGYLITSNGILFDRQDIVRIDKKVEYFTLEIFLPSLSFLSENFLDRMKKLLPHQLKYILLPRTLLRDQDKVHFIGIYDNNPYHISYLENNIEEIIQRASAQQIHPV